MLVFVLICITLCPFQFCNHLYEKQKACCFAFIFFWMSCCCKCPLALPHVPWVGLQFLIVIFSDHTNLRLDPTSVSMNESTLLRKQFSINYKRESFHYAGFPHTY